MTTPRPNIGDPLIGNFGTPKFPEGYCVTCTRLVDVQTGQGHGIDCEVPAVSTNTDFPRGQGIRDDALTTLTRVAILIDLDVRDRLISRLFEPDMRGVGYSGFIRRALDSGELASDPALADVPPVTAGDLIASQKVCVVCGNGLRVMPWGETVPAEQVATLEVEGEYFDLHIFCVRSFYWDEAEDPEAYAQQRDAAQANRGG